VPPGTPILIDIGDEAPAHPRHDDQEPEPDESDADDSCRGVDAEREGDHYRHRPDHREAPSHPDDHQRGLERVGHAVLRRHGDKIQLRHGRH